MQGSSTHVELDNSHARQLAHRQHEMLLSRHCELLSGACIRSQEGLHPAFRSCGSLTCCCLPLVHQDNCSTARETADRVIGALGDSDEEQPLVHMFRLRRGAALFGKPERCRLQTVRHLTCRLYQDSACAAPPILAEMTASLELLRSNWFCPEAPCTSLSQCHVSAWRTARHSHHRPGCTPRSVVDLVQLLCSHARSQGGDQGLRCRHRVPEHRLLSRFRGHWRGGIPRHSAE